jgi:hypothetical protein
MLKVVRDLSSALPHFLGKCVKKSCPSHESGQEQLGTPGDVGPPSSEGEVPVLPEERAVQSQLVFSYLLASTNHTFIGEVTEKPESGNAVLWLFHVRLKYLCLKASCRLKRVLLQPATSHLYNLVTSSTMVHLQFLPD